MKLIITGASGHIGNNTARMACENGIPTLCLLRREGRATLDIPCEKKIGDLFSKEFLFENILKGDSVVHSAGYIDLADKNREECYRVNYDLTRLIAEVCLEKGAHLIYVGTVDAIVKAEGIITEPARYFPECLSGSYAKSKAEATNHIISLMDTRPDFLCDIVLPTAVIGPHDYKPSAAGKIIRATLHGMAEFGIEGGYNFVDVRDVAKVILSLCKTPCSSQFIVSGKNVSVRELYEKINEIKGFKRKPIILPTIFAAPFFSKTVLRALRENPSYSCEKAETLLGFKATSFDKTLFDTINFFEDIDKCDK